MTPRLLATSEKLSRVGGHLLSVNSRRQLHCRGTYRANSNIDNENSGDTRGSCEFHPAARWACCRMDRARWRSAALPLDLYLNLRLQNSSHLARHRIRPVSPIKIPNPTTWCCEPSTIYQRPAIAHRHSEHVGRHRMGFGHRPRPRQCTSSYQDQT